LCSDHREAPSACHDLAGPWAFVDLETTGLDAASDRIVEICVERVSRGRTVGRLCEILRSDRWGGTSIHGIAEHEARGAPTFADVAAQVEHLLADAVLVAHGASLDTAFLDEELRRAGRAGLGIDVVDTLALARLAFPAERHGLHALCDARGLPHARPHRAAHDVAALRALWPHLIGALAPASAQDLIARSRSTRSPAPEILALAEQAAIDRRPVLVRYRPSGRPAQSLPFCVTGLITDLDPPRVLGYLHRTRGRRELRADRILAIEPVDEERSAPDA
jgi:DNA polymerase-3 subunit epsilon